MQSREADGSLSVDWSWSCSLEDFREFDPDVQIGSPRSLAACDVQGILPRELTYKPLEVFQLPGLDPRIAQLRYDFMEARRQDLIHAARETRQVIVELAEEAERAESPKDKERAVEPTEVARAGKDVHQLLQPNWAEGGPPDPSLAGAPTTPYPSALGFFREVLDEYSQSRAAASPRSSPMSSSFGGFDTEVTLPPVSPAINSTAFRSLRLADKRSASEGQLRDLVQRLKSAPRGNQADEEFARKSAELHLVYPKIEAKWRKEFFAERQRLAQRRADMATECFDRLIIEDEEKYEATKLREAMHQLSMEDDPTRPKRGATAVPFSMTSSRMNGSDRAASSRGFGSTMRSTTSRVSHADREEAARDKVLGTKRDFEIHRTQVLTKSVDHDRALKERVLEQHSAIKWRMASRLLEERLRWRLKYNQVLSNNEERERQKMDFFERRQEQQRLQRARCDDSGDMRKEIRHLRDVGRKLNQAQRERKEAWRQAKKKRESMEKHFAHVGMKMPTPFSPNATTMSR